MLHNDCNGTNLRTLTQLSFKSSISVVH